MKRLIVSAVLAALCAGGCEEEKKKPSNSEPLPSATDMFDKARPPGPKVKVGKGKFD